MADKRYYWLKLQKDFFKRHDIKIIKAMPNGKDYVLFYLSLLLESITHDGMLRFSDTIPYNEEMLSIVTDTNIDVVRSAMKLLVELKMVEIMDDETIYMAEVQSMMGGEAWSTERVRKFRESSNQALLVTNGNADETKSKSKSKSKSIDKDKDALGDLDSFFDSIWQQYPKKEGKGSVSKTQKQKLYDIGIEEMTRAITRYKEKLKADETTTQFIKQGSTFFNSGYIDYLDANYSESESFTQSAGNYQYDGKENSL